MNRIVDRVAVLGSGTMGAQIACHFANAGADVLLLDLPDGQGPERNRLVEANLKKALHLTPPPLYRQDLSQRIRTGNLEDDLGRVGEAAWIVEAVVEDLDVKRSLYERLEPHRRQDAIVTSNTSGLPIHALVEGRSDAFRSHFCGTHFFNPPRYMRLLEIIPAAGTDPAVVEFLHRYGDRHLGKATITAHDTPGFVANRIGVYALMLTLELMRDLDLSVTAVDRLTGPFVGRPKSATFRTVDLVGVDVLTAVSDGIHARCPQDEERQVFAVPGFLRAMVAGGRLGQKTGCGFYRKVDGADGDSEILELDLERMEYRQRGDPRFLILEAVKAEPGVRERLRAILRGDADGVGLMKRGYHKLFGADDEKAVEFCRRFHHRLLAYCSHRVPEVAGELQAIDRAMTAGFDWELGPFAIWDALGVKETLAQMEAGGHPPAGWVYEMVARGQEGFYPLEDRVGRTVDVSRASRPVGGRQRQAGAVWQGSGCALIDLGDGVLDVAFTSKGNTVDVDVLDGIDAAIDLAEREYSAIVLGNEGRDFCLGANLERIARHAYRGDYAAVEHAVTRFQQTMMRLRGCAVPVVAAARGRTLGAGVELCLHADAVQAAAESYLGLVEVSVGLIPAGGGTKEFALRAADACVEGDPEVPHLQARALTIAQCKVSGCAHDAFDLGYLRPGVDAITRNGERLLADARQRALALAAAGYVPPRPRQDIRVLGRGALALLYTGIRNLRRGEYITAYDEEIARKLAYVLCGGDLSSRTRVSEQYLLDLEREAFMSLVGNRKTLKRIEHTLKKGRPLRN